MAMKRKRAVSSPFRRFGGSFEPITFLSMEATMKKCVLIAAFCALSLDSGVTQEKSGHADQDHVMIRPEALKWGPAPPALPAGAQMAVLAGDPSMKGMPFVIRAKLPDGYKIPPHWHPSDENVTVLKGTLLVGRGEKLDPAKMEELPAGSFMRMPKEMRHCAMAKGETVIQVHGIGPFEITYVNAADDPRSKSK
jgi:hypothetical protein